MVGETCGRLAENLLLENEEELNLDIDITYRSIWFFAPGESSRGNECV